MFFYDEDGYTKAEAYFAERGLDNLRYEHDSSSLIRLAIEHYAENVLEELLHA